MPPGRLLPVLKLLLSAPATLLWLAVSVVPAPSTAVRFTITSDGV